MPSPTSRNQPANVSDYIFDSIILESERMDFEIDLSRATTDVEIFESLDRPYLTGTLVLGDNNNLIQGVDILGGEKVTITIVGTHSTSEKIKKTFYIDEIMFSRKGGDHTEVAGFHLIEDICYISNLYNISKYYDDTSFNIIEKIAKEYLGKEIATKTTPKESNTVIIPNMEPLTAMKWIVGGMSTNEGYPFYLFSTLAADKLGLYDLGTLISNQSINDDFPFRNWQAAANSDNFKVGQRAIKDYRFEKSENLYKLINLGFFGAEYEFLDTLTNKKNNTTLDIIKDLIKPLATSLLPRDQRNPTLTPAFKHEGKSFNEYKSVKKVSIGGSNAFRTATQFKTSYSENKTTAGYKAGVIADAMHNILQKTPLTIVVNGLEFLATPGHHTIGNNVTIEFLRSQVNTTSNDDHLDTKKSGKYLIYATKHMFKKEKYDVQITGVKLANMDMK